MVYGNLQWMPNNWKLLESIPVFLLESIHGAFPKSNVPLLQDTMMYVLAGYLRLNCQEGEAYHRNIPNHERDF